jgi:hypothetical protein
VRRLTISRSMGWKNLLGKEWMDSMQKLLNADPVPGPVLLNGPATSVLGGQYRRTINDNLKLDNLRSAEAVSGAESRHVL